MAIDPIHAFYCSTDYKDLSLMLKLQSGGVCAKCKGIFNVGYLRTHHIIELTLENIGDPHITLRADNIEVVCHDCHNKMHRRFGGLGNKKAYLVWGSPCAGKSSYVWQVATRYDLVIDLDRLHGAICICDLYDKPDATKREAFAMRDLLLDRIKYRAGKWENAYIIGGYPDRTEREQIARDFGAELIHIDTPREECERRAVQDGQREAMREATLLYIKNYFDRLKI